MDSQNPPKSPPYINPQIQYSHVRPSFQNLLNNQMSSFSLENFDPFTMLQINAEICDRSIHRDLQADLVEHIWSKFRDHI